MEKSANNWMAYLKKRAEIDSGNRNQRQLVASGNQCELEIWGLVLSAENPSNPYLPLYPSEAVEFSTTRPSILAEAIECEDESCLYLRNFSKLVAATAFAANATVNDGPTTKILLAAPRVSKIPASKLGGDSIFATLD